MHARQSWTMAFRTDIQQEQTQQGNIRKYQERDTTLPSGLAQTARNTASESLKQTELRKEIHRKSLTIRYDGRTFKFYPDSHTISLTTVKGGLVFPVAKSPSIGKYRGEYTSAQVCIDAKHRKMSVMVKVAMVDKEVEKKRDGNVRVTGIDRGIKNIAVLSNNMFFSSGQLRELSGREKRFVLNTNHVISKRIIGLSFNVIALENLESAGMRKKGNRRRFNTKLGSWSPYQLEHFIEYKVQDGNKPVVYVNQKYTSQKCSRCGFIDKNNRKGSVFHCLNCDFDLHADLNAARNIEALSKSGYFRLLSTSQSLRPDPQVPDSNKLESLRVE